MKKEKNMITILVILAVSILCAPKRAYAYLDPGTGSYIIQLIVGALVGSGYLIKTFWKDIKNGVKKFLGKKNGKQ